MKVDVYRRKAPKFHMGKKLEVNFKEQIPGPNIYKLPDSFGSKRSNVYKTKSPGYSMYILKCIYISWIYFLDDILFSFLFTK